jgi:hypothetical protein
MDAARLVINLNHNTGITGLPLSSYLFPRGLIQWMTHEIKANTLGKSDC